MGDQRMCLSEASAKWQTMILAVNPRNSHLLSRRNIGLLWKSFLQSCDEYYQCPVSSRALYAFSPFIVTWAVPALQGSRGLLPLKMDFNRTALSLYI